MRRPRRPTPEHRLPRHKRRLLQRKRQAPRQVFRRLPRRLPQPTPDADRVAAEAARDAAQAALAGIPTDATTLAAVLAAIMEGSNVTIDRSVDGQITVSASGAGTGVNLATVLAAIMGGTNVNIDRTTDGQITISATGAGGTGITLATALAAIMEGTGIAIDRTTTGEITLSADGLNTAAVNTLIGAAGHLVAASNLSDVADAATALGNLGGRTQSEIDTQADARIAALVNAFARDNASLIPAAQIPAAIARVADLVNGINQISYSGLGTGPHLTLIRDLGQSEELPLPDWLVPFNAALTGDPTTPTPADGDNDTSIANTEWVNRTIAAGGGTPTPVTDDLYFGTSADAIPTSAELTIPGVNGAGVIPMYAGSRHHLIARLASEDDITSVIYSDDPTRDNEVAAFAKYADTVIPSGETEAFSVWVSHQLLTNPADVTVTVG